MNKVASSNNIVIDSARFAELLYALNNGFEQDFAWSIRSPITTTLSLLWSKEPLVAQWKAEMPEAIESGFRRVLQNKRLLFPAIADEEVRESVNDHISGDKDLIAAQFTLDFPAHFKSLDVQYWIDRTKRSRAMSAHARANGCLFDLDHSDFLLPFIKTSDSEAQNMSHFKFLYDLSADPAKVASICETDRNTSELDEKLTLLFCAAAAFRGYPNLEHMSYFGSNFVQHPIRSVGYSGAETIKREEYRATCGETIAALFAIEDARIGKTPEERQKRYADTIAWFRSSEFEHQELFECEDDKDALNCIERILNARMSIEPVFDSTILFTQLATLAAWNAVQSSLKLSLIPEPAGELAVEMATLAAMTKPLNRARKQLFLNRIKGEYSRIKMDSIA